MFTLPLFSLVVLVMAIIHISIFQIFPVGMKNIIMANPIFAFLIDLGGTSFIEQFTGVAAFVGIANLTASVLFGAYAFWYKKHYHITGLGIRWVKMFKVIPVFPVPYAQTK